MSAPSTNNKSSSRGAAESSPGSEICGHPQHRRPDFNAAPTCREGLFNRLEPIELRRRVWHMAPGFLAFLLWPIPHADPISPTLRTIVILIGTGVGLTIFVQFRRITRNATLNDRLSAVVGYAGSVLLTLLLFPRQAELGLTVLAVLAFGDGSATLGGILFGGPTLPWNRRKTWSGLLSFLAVGVPMASVVYWGESHNLEALQPGVPFSTALVCGAAAVLTAAIAESVPSRINDNIRVGVSAAIAAATAHGLMVGWQ